MIISSLRLSLGEYGHQRTSTKFHDLVLNLKFQAPFSQRKVSKNILIVLRTGQYF